MKYKSLIMATHWKPNIKIWWFELIFPPSLLVIENLQNHCIFKFLISNLSFWWNFTNKENAAMYQHRFSSEQCFHNHLYHGWKFHSCSLCGWEEGHPDSHYIWLCPISGALWPLAGYWVHNLESHPIQGSWWVLIHTTYSSNVISYARSRNSFHSFHFLYRKCFKTNLNASFQIPSPTKFTISTYDFSFHFTITSVACAVDPSVTMSSTNFSFQNLVFWNLFEFSVAEIT